MEADIWEKLFSEKTKKKDGKSLLPGEWTRVFSKKIDKSTHFIVLLLTYIRYRRELCTYFLHHFVVLLLDVLQKEIFICTPTLLLLLLLLILYFKLVGYK